MLPDGGGRVTELMARPLLSLVAPDLGGFDQPLAGETAARRPLLESLPFPVGYGVETAILIDALRACSLEALAEVDLGTRLNRHQPLRDLERDGAGGAVGGPAPGAAPEALEALAPGRMLLPGREGDDPEIRDVPIAERPPLREVRAAAPRRERAGRHRRRRPGGPRDGARLPRGGRRPRGAHPERRRPPPVPTARR